MLANAVVKLVNVLDKDQENFQNIPLPPPPVLDEVDGTVTTLAYYLRQLPPSVRMTLCNQLTNFVSHKVIQYKSMNP